MQQTSDPLRFDRRSSPRRPAAGSAMAAFRDDQGGAHLVRVELEDTSDGGLRVLCPVPAPVGSPFAIVREAGPSPAAALLPPVRHEATVVRCRETDFGFDLGLSLRLRAAA
jgi:hypothetical protein